MPTTVLVQRGDPITVGRATTVRIVNDVINGPTTQHVQVTAVVFVTTSPEKFALSVQGLLEQTSFPVVVGTLYNVYAKEFERFSERYGDRISIRPFGSVSELINTVYAERRTHVLAVNDAVVFPPQPFDVALGWIEDDVRYSTISFLSNAADFLSFPVRNLPTPRIVDHHDQTTITRKLRAMSPTAAPTPVMYAAGAVVLISAFALGAVGELVAPASARFDIAISDFSVRAREKGFIDIVDASTFIARTGDVAVDPIDHTLTYDDRGWLLHRHQAMVAFVDRERTSGDSPFALAHQVARVKVNGLRVLIDGACFGPHQVGTQVATSHTIQALAAHPDVAEVCVAIPGAVPDYAADVLTGAKVKAFAPPGGDLRAFGQIDVAYRPYQPNPGFDLQSWKHAGVRFVIAVLDTIAFHNGGYFATTGDWMTQRDFLFQCVKQADAVTVISNDVVDQMRLHRFPISSHRVHSVPLGTEHLRGDETTELPQELLVRGFTTGPFALCMGTNYTHKNREIVMRAHGLLREQGIDLKLVMTGLAIPYGSTRVAEARVGTHEDTFVIPEVTPNERNWLLRHASFVWYPTSAEGFGLVPFEAAAFGTPTVAVDFGPIRELATIDSTVDASSGFPMLSPDWSAESLAALALKFLSDPAVSDLQVQSILRASAHYSWGATADALVVLFRNLLAEPSR